MLLMPASTEFAALCQSQIAMMAETLGADSTAVYLAEGWSDQGLPKLIPIAVYPPSSTTSVSSSLADRALPSASTPVSSADSEHFFSTPHDVEEEAAFLKQKPQQSSQRLTDHPSQAVSQRLAVPIMHEGNVFGILVGWRADHPWQTPEQDRVEEYARSLALACVLDQRGQWLKTQLSSLDRVQDQQSDRFHELLHQLKSPLTAFKTFGKLLTKRLPATNPNQALVLNMLRESDRMQELLGYFDDTLQAADETREETATNIPLLAPATDPPQDIARALPEQTDSLSYFGGTLNIQPCAIAELIAPLIDLTRTLAEAADLSFQVIPPVQSEPILADPKALIEILNNFIDNSLKYSSPGARLWLQWGLVSASQPNLLGILVGDTGPGIPAADQARIFERHFRGVQAAGSLEGSGLGLAIAHDLVQEMNGHIQVYSPLIHLPWALPPAIQALQPTQGTAFVIWLPKAVPSATVY